jgi:methionyl-tRNA formyltransferase/peptidoglycan/xylan/chitin deacetylase (PgdA/CDA1 family)
VQPREVGQGAVEGRRLSDIWEAEIDTVAIPYSPLNVVVFSCGDLGIEVANALRNVDGVSVVTLVTAPYRRRQLTLSGKIRHVRRNQGWRGLVEVAAHKVRGSFRKETAVETRFLLDPAVAHLHFEDFHDPDCLAALKKLQPDLGVIAGTYILKASVFAAPRLGSINLHSGKVPKYRGAAPAFWELYNGESEVGITIHRVVAEVDAGSILKQEIFPLNNAPEGDVIEYLERYRSVVLRPNGVRMLAEVVGKIAGGTVEEAPQDHGHAITYKSPDYRAIQELKRVVRRRRAKKWVAWKLLVKTVLGRLAYATGLYRIFMKNKAMIVLFHRVDDRLKGDPISYPVGKFESFCKFFIRYFKVVGLKDLLDRLARGQDVSGYLVITFDDGYRDNWEIAAKRLGELNLPACFFLATDFISSNKSPWWDLKHAAVSEWMTWEDVRRLRAAGFEIGSHTISHIDLGTTTGERAASEIVGSKQRLESEIREAVPYFSYPYGGRSQMLEENREVVREAGYACCLSAYGGAVGRESSPFSLNRVPISNWYVSPYHFGFEAMLIKP